MEAAEEVSADDEDEVMYIRFGDIPAGGRSLNQETDTYEAGVSVYRAVWDSKDRDVVSVFVPSEICWGTIREVMDRPVYIVTGRVLDEVGGDGEPLMVDVVAELVGPVEAVNYCIEDE